MIAKLAQLPLRERLGLTLALAFLVLLLADAFVIKPGLLHIRALDASILQEEVVLHRARGVLQYKDSVILQHNEIKDLLGVTGPEAETIESFKNELDELAIRSGVALRSMRHLAPEKTDHLITYVIEVGDYECDVSNLLQFLRAIHSAPGLMRVRQLSIGSQVDDGTVKGSFSVTRVMTRSQAAGIEL